MTIPSVASDLSGMSEPRGMLTPEMSGRASSPVLVGRDEQMAALDAAFASARQGGPSAVLLGGEAGVGKSRLVGEFARTAAAGARVLTGGCLELGTDGLPFAPFTAVLRDLVHEMGADAVAAMLPGRTTRGLARLLPELGEPDTGGDPAEARARLFEEVLRALEYLTRHSPVVLVIEDALLHAAEAALACGDRAGAAERLWRIPSASSTPPSAQAGSRTKPICLRFRVL